LTAKPVGGYLSFERTGKSPSGKTWIVVVYGVRARLGEIRWFGRWRHYAFFPDDGTLYNPDCMGEIASMCRALMSERARVSDNEMAEGLTQPETDERVAFIPSAQRVESSNPPCASCGGLTIRTGTCYTCTTCGTSEGCG
jgi:hypothetical protein